MTHPWVRKQDQKGEIGWIFLFSIKMKTLCMFLYSSAMKQFKLLLVLRVFYLIFILHQYGKILLSRNLSQLQKIVIKTSFGQLKTWSLRGTLGKANKWRNNYGLANKVFKRETVLLWGNSRISFQTDCCKLCQSNIWYKICFLLILQPWN